jgi:hypothetical protein
VQCVPDPFGHRLPLGKHIAVPKSEHYKSFSPQPSIAPRVIRLLIRSIVLATVKLHDDATIETDEVGNVIPQRNLSPKFES